MGRHMMGGGMMGGGFGPARLCENREARTAGMLAFAERRLGITEAQRPAWDAFRQAVEASGAPVREACAELAGADRPSTLPQRLARMERMGDAHLSQLKAVRPALDTLYAQLTPEQRESADAMMSHGRRGGRQ
jgi:hypothetical protein